MFEVFETLFDPCADAWHCTVKLNIICDGAFYNAGLDCHFESNTTIICSSISYCICDSTLLVQQWRESCRGCSTLLLLIIALKGTNNALNSYITAATCEKHAVHNSLEESVIVSIFTRASLLQLAL